MIANTGLDIQLILWHSKKYTIDFRCRRALEGTAIRALGGTAIRALGGTAIRALGGTAIRAPAILSVPDATLRVMDTYSDIPDTSFEIPLSEAEQVALRP